MRDERLLYLSALHFVREQGQAAIKEIAARFALTYADAGRLLDRMEDAGHVGPYNGSRPRALVKIDGSFSESRL